MALPPALVHNRLGAERAFTIDEGIVAGLRAVATEARVSFPELLTLTINLALLDGTDLPTAAGLAERTGISTELAKTYIALLRSSGWLIVSETSGEDGARRKIWMLKRSGSEVAPPADLKVPFLPTSLDELLTAWASVTSRPISPQHRALVNKALNEGKIAGSPRHSDLVAKFFHQMRPTAGIMELVNELGEEPDLVVEAALFWKTEGEPNLADADHLAIGCQGLWKNAHKQGNFKFEHYQILAAVIRGMTPQIFKSFCKPEYKLKDAIELALRERPLVQEDVSPISVNPSSTTLERFMKEDISL